MDYEKKYKEAIKRAKAVLEIAANKEEAEGYVSTIFPELKESEDERIRKEIIYHIKNCDDTIDEETEKRMLSWLEKQKPVQNINKEDEEVRQYIIRIMEQRDINVPMVQKALTWLEKQGEQKPRYSIGDVLCDKSCTTFNKGAQPNFEITDIRNGMYICDKCSFPISQQDEYELVAKRIEQKPTFEMKTPEESLGISSEEYKKIVDTCLYGEKIESKSAWSEEDERTIHNIDAAIRHKVEFPIDELKSMKIWLESLKYRIRPKHEWKRDEKMFQLIEDVIDVYRKTQGSVIGGVHTEELKDYLKSLKPQNTWKPSDEQMESLEQFISEYKDIDDSNRAYPISHIIESLYNDLKKLKGE